MDRLLQNIGAFVALQLLYSGISHACSCEDGGSAVERMEGADQVFVGDRQGVRPGCGGTERVDFQVEVGIKGVEDGDAITVKNAGLDCDAFQDADTGRWLVFATDGATHYCDSNIPNPDDETIAELVSASE